MTPDTDAARTLLARPEVEQLLAALDRDGEQTRIVGGAVRNALLGRAVREIDLTTTALPRETMRRARKAGFKAIPTGIDHGTVTVVVAGEPFEVTTLREDVETDGRHATVRFGRDFVRDAARRDFTINAMSLDRQGRVSDSCGGLADLAAGRVRFIGDAMARVREDYLRILRLFRFHAEYGTGPIDPDGLEAAIAGRDGLDLISAERVRQELLKLAGAARAPETAALLSQAGLLARLTGGVGDAGRLARAASDGLDATGRLGAWLVLAREDAERLRERLRLSNAERDRFVAYADSVAAMRSGPLDEGAVRRLAYLRGTRALADAKAATSHEPGIEMDAAAATTLSALADGRLAAPVFPLAGAALIAAGATAGPGLGRRLAESRRRWLAAGCPDPWGPDD